jgi:anti-anti-sigma factor
MMEHTASVGGFREGERVEVLTRFTDAWTSGFEVAAASEVGCRLRRVSDGAVLPAVFGYDVVRPASPQPGPNGHPSSVPRRSLERDASSVVLRLPADLDVATVEEIGGAVLDAVDRARGAVVLDLDGVRFLDSYGIRLLATVRRRAWERDVAVRLLGGTPRLRALLDLVGLDPWFQPELADPQSRVPIG